MEASDPHSRYSKLAIGRSVPTSAMEPKTAHYLHAAPATLPMLPELLSPSQKSKGARPKPAPTKRKVPRMLTKADARPPWQGCQVLLPPLTLAGTSPARPSPTHRPRFRHASTSPVYTCTFHTHVSVTRVSATVAALIFGIAQNVLVPLDEILPAIKV